MQYSVYYLNPTEMRRSQRRDLLCNHNDGDLFMCEDNMLFHKWRYEVFA